MSLCPCRTIYLCWKVTLHVDSIDLCQLALELLQDTCQWLHGGRIRSGKLNESLDDFVNAFEQV